MSKILIKKRVEAKVVEAVVLLLMVMFGIAAIYIFFKVINLQNPDPLIVVIEMFLLVIIAMLGLTFVVTKVWEQHIKVDYIHKVHHKKVARKSAKDSKKKAKRSKKRKVKR